MALFFPQRSLGDFSLKKTTLDSHPSLSPNAATELYEIGTLSRIERMLRTDGEINALVRGISRRPSLCRIAGLQSGAGTERSRG